MRTTHHPTDGPADSTVAAPYRLPVLATRAGRRERPLSAWVVAVTLLVVGAVTVTVMAADSSSPAAAAPASAWAQVSAGANHTCALTVAGEAFCWGSDGFGQLGNGAAITVDQVSPSPVNTPAGVTWASISVGERHTCALTVTGEAFCWGSDAQGRLGNGAAFTSNRVSPSPVNTPAGVTWDRMSAGLAQTCGVTVTGEAFCWGDDLFGQLGNGALTGDRESPSEVDDPAGVTWASISAGLLHTCGVTDAGEGFCWGNDGFGQLGNGSSVTGNQVTPSPVVAPAGVTWSSIDTGGFHSCGLTDAGAAFCWGEGFFGRLGNGAAGDESSPSPVDTPVGVTWAAISAREEHTCAVSDAGDAFCWGRDSSGQLGNGAALDTDRVSPSPVDTPAGVTWSAVSAGFAHSCGLTDTGDIFCWGRDAVGQLGNGAEITGDQPSPSLVARPPGPEPPPPAIPAPAGLTSGDTTVSGTYRPIVLDHNGDSRGDVLWYGRGSAPDSLWVGQGAGRFTYNQAIDVRNHWDDVIALDINGTGREDVLFYNRSSGQAALWLWNPDGTFTSQRFTPGPRRRPVVGDFTGDGRANVLWYGPGGLTDSFWTWSNGAVQITSRTVKGRYTPLVGDFDGNDIDDIFWYGPDSAPDSMWLHRPGGGFRVVKRPVAGTYRPIVGDVDGNGRDDVIWYDPGGPNSVWFEFTGTTLVVQRFAINVDATPVVADLQGDGRDDIIWYNPAGTGHLWTRWSGGRARTSVSLTLPGGLVPLVGPFSAGGADGIFWYGPGPTVDAVWYR